MDDNYADYHGAAHRELFQFMSLLAYPGGIPRVLMRASMMGQQAREELRDHLEAVEVCKATILRALDAADRGEKNGGR